MATFRFDLVSPEKLLFSGEAESVIIPGAEGEFTMLAQHAPLIALLKPGVLTIAAASGAQRIYVSGGFADATPAGLTILAEEARPMSETEAAAFRPGEPTAATITSPTQAAGARPDKAVSPL